MDEWALLDEIDITAHLPNEFFETIRATKWTERRDCIQALIDVISRNRRLNPKIKYNEIIAELKLIIIKDSNIVVVTLALRALTLFVKGLRQNFVKYIPMVLVHVLEKFKEKKATVKEAVVECLSVIAQNCDNAVLIGPLCEVLEKTSNPDVKANVDQWIYCILCHYPRTSVPTAFIKSVAPYLVKHSSDGDASVREGSYTAFGAIMRLVEAKATACIADGVFCDKVKWKKIAEYSEKAQKDFEAYEETRRKADLSEVQPCASGEDKENDTALNGDEAQLVAAMTDPWELLTETKICDRIPHDMLTILASKQWKERKEKLEELCEILEKNPRLCPDEDHSELIGVLRNLLEKDVNINVAALAAKCITDFANGLRFRFAAYIPKIYVSAFEKFKERKTVLREPLLELCDVLALFAPISTYIDAVEAALQKSNPQIKTQTALFVSRVLRQHSAQTLPLDCVRQRLGPALVKLSVDADPDTRDASFVVAGAIMRIVGENALNICCGEIMRDENKLAKVRENCERLTKEFGTGASAAILRLHNKSKSSENTEKAKAVRIVNGNAANKASFGPKRKVEITKKLPGGASAMRPKTHNTIQKQQIIKAVRSQSARLLLSVASKTDSSSMKQSKFNEPIRISHLKGGSAMAEATGARDRRSDETTSSEKRSSSERDEFFDAAEELDVASHSASDPDSSNGKNRTFTVERKESVAETVALKGQVPLERPSCEVKRSASAISAFSSVASGKPRLPSRIPRRTSRSGIPIPVYRRT